MTDKKCIDTTIVDKRAVQYALDCVMPAEVIISALRVIQRCPHMSILDAVVHGMREWDL